MEKAVYKNTVVQCEQDLSLAKVLPLISELNGHTALSNDLNCLIFRQECNKKDSLKGVFFFVVKSKF